MGVAAYNRGSALIRRQIAADDRPHEFYVLDRLNSLPRGSRKIFEATVIRPDESGRWWLMNRKADGWGEYGIPYDSIRELVAVWSIAIVGLGSDRHSFFYDVTPI